MSSDQNKLSDDISDPSPGADQAPTPSREDFSKRQRVLACVLCQQRKVKCDRRFPCANCVRAQVTCVPAAQTPRQRRRRYPERDLLERIRHYEELMRQSNVTFEPLHKDLSARYNTSNSKESQTKARTELDSPLESATAQSEPHEPAKDIWHAMSQGYRSSDCENDCYDEYSGIGLVRSSWNQLFLDSDHPFFGRATAIDLSALHPEPIQIFRLWQTYLENVNPLLKVSHTPTLQGRVINAASNMANIDPNLEVLMFGIYCISVVSVGADCESVFGEGKESLLARYQFGCQQALLNAAFLRTNNLECLTGFFLYLISIRRTMHVRSLSSLFGIAMQTAQRIGIHRESFHANCAVFEAEVRRRLWWSLVMFDARIGELADSRTSPLDPTWDCRIPLNVNESDLQPSMTDQPTAHLASTDAIFAVVRYELGDFIRHSTFHLDFMNPALKPLARHSINQNASASEVVSSLAKAIEDKYLKFCDPRIPLHYMTIWTTRATLAKYCFYSRLTEPGAAQTPALRDDVLSYALKWIEYDTKAVKSPLTKGFQWLLHSYFPLPAYVRIFHDLRRRPTNLDSGRRWEVISDNYISRMVLKDQMYKDENYVRIFSGMVLQAWRVREAALHDQGQPIVVPTVVSHILTHVIEKPGATGSIAPMSRDDGSEDLQRAMLNEFGSSGMPFGMLENDSTAVNTGVLGSSSVDDNTGVSWSPIDWNFVD